MIAANPAPDRTADTLRFYALHARLKEHTGGYRYLATCDGRMNWPRRGVYFFFEDGEGRSKPNRGLRVVRIGTHALKAASQSSLWDRLSQHRGSSRSGTGNHRGSIFRLIVGVALARRGDTPLPPSWGVGSERKRSGSPTRRGPRDSEARGSRSRTTGKRTHWPYAFPVALRRRPTGSGQPARCDREKRHRAAQSCPGTGGRSPDQPLVGCVQRSTKGSRVRIVEQPSRR